MSSEQDKKKAAGALDKDLDEALKESFPASDVPAVGQVSREADRPAHRQAPVIDIESVRRIARKVK